MLVLNAGVGAPAVAVYQVAKQPGTATPATVTLPPEDLTLAVAALKDWLPLPAF